VIMSKREHSGGQRREKRGADSAVVVVLVISDDPRLLPRDMALFLRSQASKQAAVRTRLGQEGAEAMERMGRQLDTANASPIENTQVLPETDNGSCAVRRKM
jgi:hypothetical protein